jgi:hypothetical protein
MDEGPDKRRVLRDPLVALVREIEFEGVARQRDGGSAHN